MAKRTNDGTTRQTTGNAVARRAPTRRRTATSAEAATALAADMAGRGSIAQTAGAAPSNEEIARLAYTLYLERGGVNGSHLEDWLEAERRLRGQR
jgi:hypothetical protein